MSTALYEADVDPMHLAGMNPHQRYSASLSALFGSVIRNRDLIFQMAKREIVSRYRGSLIGLVWSLFNPLLMLVTYTFVFSAVFKSRWTVEDTGGNATFAIVLFAGMAVYGFFAECVNRAPSLVISNPNYVKRVVFPLEVIPWVATGAGLFHACINVVILVTAQFLLAHQLPWTLILFPVMLLPLILTTVGLAWFLAATGVFMRDIGQVTGVITTMMLFLAPVFYSRSTLPEQYQRWLVLNPLTFSVEAARQTLLWGQVPSLEGLAIYYVVSLGLCWMGFWWFQRTRRGFSDVL